jgi:ubiquinone/menaquinone biosynthesis C-methylase UbiE
MHGADYSLGDNAAAARRLEVQDAQFAAISEALLDSLDLRPTDHVLELGCGAGSFSRRIMRRLGTGGALTCIDYTQGLLDQAAERLREANGPSSDRRARLELVKCDIHEAGRLAAAADAVVARTVLHHLPFPEVFLGRLRRDLRPGTKLGFIEPEFRALLGRLAWQERQGRAELAPLRRWAEGISRYYQRVAVAPAIGASLAATMRAAGYSQVHCEWWECPTDAIALENMTLYYGEVRNNYIAQGLMTAAEIDRDVQCLAALSDDERSNASLPPVWGLYRVTGVA